MIRSNPLTIPKRGLVAEFLLDGNANDTSGNGYNGTATNVTWLPAERGYVRQMADLNKNNHSKISIPNHITDDFTICAWVKTTDKGTETAHYKTLAIYHAEASGVRNDFGFGIDSNGHLAFGCGGSSDVTFSGNTYISDGKWHFCVATREKSSGNIKLYVDGKYDGGGSHSSGVRLNAVSTAYIGYANDDSGGVYHSLSIGLVRLYNRVLTPSEINALYLEGLRKLGPSVTQQYSDLFRGCVGYWDFRNGSLVNLIDGTNATNNGAILTTDHLGNSNSAYYFNDDNEPKTWIDIPANIGGEMSFFIIGNKNNLGNLGHFLCIGANGSAGDVLGIWVDTDDHIYIGAYRTGYSWQKLQGPVITTGEIYYIYGGITNSKLYLNVNGVDYGSLSINGYDATRQQIRLGRNYYNSNGGNVGLKGKVSLLLKYNRLLSNNEIKQLYNLFSKKYIYPTPKYTPPFIPKPILHIDGTNNGTVYYDQSGHGHHGTQSGGVGSGTIGLHKYMSFDGSNDYIDLGTNPFSSEIGNTFTIAYIVKLNDLSNRGIQIFFAQSGSSIQSRNTGIGLNILADSKIINLFSGKGYYNSSNDLRSVNVNYNPDNNYHLIVATEENTTVKIYLDGKLIGSGTTHSGNILWNTNNYARGKHLLGAYYHSGTIQEYFNGIIVDVKVFNQALTPEQIQALYYSTFIS